VDERIVVWDDGSSERMWDFCLVDDSGMHRGSMEVTRYTDPERRAFAIELLKRGQIWEAPQHVTGSWVVQLRPSFQLKSESGRARLFELLKTADREGLDRISGSRSHDALKLGVFVALRLDGPGGSIRVLGAGEGWFGDDHVARGAIQEAQANREKLMASPAPRHLFVWIDWAALAAMFEMTDRMPPPEYPVDLPDYVDVAWAACGEADVSGAALWRAERGMPWTMVRPFMTDAL
jgi:hypothetical protein